MLLSVLLSVLLAIVLIASACSGAETGTAPAPTDPLSTLDWHPCDGIDGHEVECADMEVPRNWDDPEGHQIILALARRPATGERIGSVIMNPGGPGASGVDSIKRGPFTPTVHQSYDVVSWDPRGVGDSTALSCNDVDAFLALDPSPNTEQDRRILSDAAAAVAENCERTDGPLLPYLGTDAAVQDLEAIRVALGNKPLNYVGFSFGTAIGQRYAQRHGANVSKMVLDGVVDTSLDFEELLLGQVAGFESSFRRFDTECIRAGQSRCGVDSLTGAFDTVAEAVEVTPLPSEGTPIGPAQLATAAIYSSYLSNGWLRLGPALGDALDGDGQALWDLAEGYYRFAEFGTYAAVFCTDNPRPRDQEEYQAFERKATEVSPRFGPSVANELLPCATWPVPASPDTREITAPNAPTILVVGNTGDPATPLENAEAVSERLSSSRLLVVDSAGHTAYSTNDCARSTIDEYLLGGTLPADGSRC